MPSLVTVGLDEVGGVRALVVERLVDRAVAVVVDAVAQLGAAARQGGAVRLHRAAHGRVRAVADVGARRAAGAVAGRGQAVVARARLAVVGDVLVDEAVAVVVERVADLGRPPAQVGLHTPGREGALPRAGRARDRRRRGGALGRRRRRG